jgi:hypothetical protein
MIEEFVKDTPVDIFQGFIILCKDVYYIVNDWPPDVTGSYIPNDNPVHDCVQVLMSLRYPVVFLPLYADTSE